MLVPLCTKFSLPNGLHMFTAWPYWFSLVHANYRPIVTYRPDQGNQLCTIEIRAKLGGYQLQTSFLPSALWERQKRWEFPPPNGSHESQWDVMQSRLASDVSFSLHLFCSDVCLLSVQLKTPNDVYTLRGTIHVADQPL